MTVDHTSGIGRWYLHDVTNELRQCLQDQFTGDMLRRIGVVDRMLTVETGRGSSQLERRRIFLGVELQCLYLLRGLARAEDQHPCGQGIEGPRMPHLDSLNFQPLGDEITDMRQRPETRHPIWLVDVYVFSLYEVHLIDHC